MLPSTSRRLNHYVLYKAVHGFFTSNNATRDFLLPFLEEVSGLGLKGTGLASLSSSPSVVVSHPKDLSCYLLYQSNEASSPF